MPTESLGMASAFPQAIPTTFVDGSRLEKLQNAYDQRQRVLEDNVIVVPTKNGKRSIGEEEVIDMVASRVMYQFITPERDIKLPAMELNKKLLKGAVVLFKQDSGTPSGTLKPPELATTDDLVIQFATPQVYNRLGSGSADNFIQSGLTAGDVVQVVNDEGITGSGGGNLTAGDDDWLFFTGDFIDMNADSIITQVQFTDVDDEDYGSTPAIVSERASNLHLITASGHLIKETVSVDAYAYDDGDAELVPMCLNISDGSNAIEL